ncbi:MAG: enoyl-CoA hydratase/isomerase family protein [Ruminococcaceae bacterium]|nr:enoyl-CoA hydratase/isomerase family protein [Oscillospiraceae bacterium]
MAQGTYIHYEKQGNIACVTLNRPDKMNIMDTAVWQELYACQNAIEADAAVRAVVINAEGKHFCAGIDLKMLKAASSQHMLEHGAWQHRLYGRWQEWSIPVIAAVQGVCYGSGVELILGCDIRLSADNARYQMQEVKFALAPDMGGTTRLTKLVGIGQAKRMILACEEVDAAEALRIGLVEEVVPLAELNARAMALAGKMAALPPAAMGFAKRGINLAQENSTQAGLLFEYAQGVYCNGSAEQKEACAAFLEKREPKFE